MTKFIKLGFKRCTMGSRVYWLLIAALALASCSSGISAEEAEKVALDFITEHGRFFSNEDVGRLDIIKYKYLDVETTPKEDGYEVSLTVTAKVNNVTRSASVVATVDNNGQVQGLKKKPD